MPGSSPGMTNEAPYVRDRTPSHSNSNRLFPARIRRWSRRMQRTCCCRSRFFPCRRYSPRQAGSESQFRYPEEDNPGLFYWSGERFGCVIAAKADDDLVLRIAEIVYQ